MQTPETQGNKKLLAEHPQLRNGKAQSAVRVLS